MLKELKRIIAEDPQSPDRWLKEPRNNHGKPDDFSIFGHNRDLLIMNLH